MREFLSVSSHKTGPTKNLLIVRFDFARLFFSFGRLGRSLHAARPASYEWRSQFKGLIEKMQNPLLSQTEQAPQEQIDRSKEKSTYVGDRSHKKYEQIIKLPQEIMQQQVGRTQIELLRGLSFNKIWNQDKYLTI